MKKHPITLRLAARSVLLFPFGFIASIDSIAEASSDNISAPFQLDLRLTFNEWAAKEGIPAEGNSMLDYALGASFNETFGRDRIEMELNPDWNELIFIYTLNRGAVGVSTIIEVTTDLMTWVPAVPLYSDILVWGDDADVHAAYFEIDENDTSQFYRIRVVNDSE